MLTNNRARLALALGAGFTNEGGVFGAGRLVASLGRWAAGAAVAGRLVVAAATGRFAVPVDDEDVVGRCAGR